ncbi:hypothetical protein ACS4RR_021025 [Rhizobium sp. Z1P35]
MYPGSPSKIACSAMPLGWQSGTDMTANISLIDDAADMRRSWNGRIRNFADPSFRLYRVELSSGDGEYMTPALTRLMPGDEFSLTIDADFEDFIATGGTTRTLTRDPYAGSIKAKNLGWNDIPFSIAGRVVTLSSAAATPVRISYRPVLQVAVTEPVKWSERATDRKVSWSLTVEEIGSDS